VKLSIAHDPAAPYDKAVHALTFRRVKNLKLRNLEVIWEGPAYDRWRSALLLEDISGLEVQSFSGGPAGVGRRAAAVVLSQVEDAVIRQSRASGGTDVFLEVRGDRSRGIAVWGNDVRNASVPLMSSPEVRPGAVVARDNMGKSDR
jgi:hypothetical protein